MSIEQERLKEILAEAAGKETVQARAAYLDAACGGNPELRAEVEHLLEANHLAGDFLESSVLRPFEEPVGEGPGTVIGRYKLLQEIGEGAFGVVFMAEQTEPVQRKVALKIIKPGMDTREVIARFEAERQALALMDHPNIARVLDAGATATGRPYFVMELVKGIPLTDYCDQEQLPPAARLLLFMKVCQAVQHAHQRGIIHRDLKPGNILVTVIDGEAVPKIIDFGVAKALGHKLTEKTLFTAFAQIIGTPAYMSPEQAALSGVDVDTRSDIYSLGVLLYELLTGVTPFDQEALLKAGLDEIRRIIRETEPAKPSTRLRTMGEKLTDVAKRRRSEPAALPRLLHGDLDWIVMKALDKDRVRRYGSAGALLEDLQHHLRHEPVLAGPPGVGYRLRKFARRRRGLLAAGIGVAVICAAVVVASWQSAERRQAEQAARTKDAQLEVLQTTLAGSGNLAASEKGRGLITGVLNVEPGAALSPDETMLAYEEEDGANMDLMLRDLKTGQVSNLTRAPKDSKYFHMADGQMWSPDSKSIAYIWNRIGDDLLEDVRVVSVATGEIRVLTPASSQPWISWKLQDWSADCRFLLCDRGVIKMPPDSTVFSLALVEVETGKVRELGLPSGKHARLSPDGAFIVLAHGKANEAGQDSRSDLCLVEIESGRTNRLTYNDRSTTPIWAPGEPVILFSSQDYGGWDLWGVRLEKGIPVGPAFPVRYGIGSFDKRLTQSGKLIVHRKVSPADGYTIAEGAPTTDGTSVPAFSGTIYVNIKGRLHTLTSQESQGMVRPLGIAGVPSKELHGGLRCYLEARELPCPQTGTNAVLTRHGLFAVAVEGTAERAVQLTDLSGMAIGSDLQWAFDYERSLPDGRISFVVPQALPAGEANPQSKPSENAGIYSAQVAFDNSGYVIGLVAQPDKPLVEVAEVNRQPMREPPVPGAQGHSWSPDGTEITYVVRAEARAPGEIRILNLCSGEARTLVQGCNPVWSPDGARIAFRSEHQAILTIHPDGSGLQTWVRREALAGGMLDLSRDGYQELVWSLDSQALLYGYYFSSGSKDTFLVTEPGVEPRKLTHNIVGRAAPVAWLKGGE